VSVSVTPPEGERNRLTAAFRLVLALPHLILVGGVGLSFVFTDSDNGLLSLSGHDGLLGGVAIILAIVSWFTIVLGGEHITAIRQFTAFVMRWRTRAIAYTMLLVDPYPPFGDAAYPTVYEVADPSAARRRWSVALRLILAIPQLVALAFVMLAWWIVSIIAWFAILVSGRYPSGLYDFGVGALRWLLRVESYMLLLVDEYPPFSIRE
jgi:Domain of unknown function (DUF4389)